MKPIKLLALLTASLMIITLLCGCGDNKTNTEESQVESSASVITTDAPDTKQPQTSNASYITSKEDFDELFDTILPDTGYYLEESSGSTYNSYHYSLVPEDMVDYDLDYSVKHSDGTEFTLPISVKDIESKGWNFKDSDYKDETLSSGYAFASSIPFVNSQDSTMRFYIFNDTDDKAKLTDCTASGVEFEIPDATADYFTICGNITNNSTIEDIINCLGAPSTIDLTIWNNDNGEYDRTNIKLTFTQKSNLTSSLYFEISGDENRITNLQYKAN